MKNYTLRVRWEDILRLSDYNAEDESGWNILEDYLTELKITWIYNPGSYGYRYILTCTTEELLLLRIRFPFIKNADISEQVIANRPKKILKKSLRKS